MKPSRTELSKLSSIVVALVLACGWLHAPASAEQLILLRNGMTLRGSYVAISSLNQNPFAVGGAGEIQTRPIWMVDDGLRRIYIHARGMVAQPPTEVADLGGTITFPQPTPLGGEEVQGIGQIYGVTKFNEYGRRQIFVRGPEGNPLEIFQGITEINDRYAKVEGLQSTPSYVWDMRIATSTIDSPTLNAIFRTHLDQSDIEQRLEVVRFFIKTRRYGDAHAALRQIIQDFPEEKQLEAQLIALTESQATQLLDEANLRAEAGQTQLAGQILKNFPVDQVGRVTQLKVEDARAQLAAPQQQASELVDRLRRQLDQLGGQDAAALQPLVDEMAQGLSAATLPRLSDYARLGEAENLALENRVALAIAGWILGNGSGEQNLKIAISLVQVRDLVREYLASHDAARRKQILEQLANLEGAQPEYVERLLPLLRPPLSFSEESVSAEIPGLFQVGLPDGEADAEQPQQADQLQQADQPRYVIQLPPEYDPLRSYPCVLALHPIGGQPHEQVQWWAGPWDADLQARKGHATRNGFIVVAPAWTRENQNLYEFTPREHHRVLAALRHAMRRASIDADRVFIAGHGEGATAAWDIAIAHPDLWAGMISISGEPRKTVPHYNSNAASIPMYLVMGERDGAPAPLIRNGPIMDDYMNFRNDAMVVMYRGRGREYFYEEIPFLFEWMKLPKHRRPDMPRDIEAATMRHGDQFFWWLELGEILPGVAINPILWEQAERKKAGPVSAAVLADNQIRVSQVPSERFTVWLRPGMGIDLSKRVTIRYRSRPIYVDFDGGLQTLLEDARRRADRKRPFWHSVTVP